MMLGGLLCFLLVYQVQGLVDLNVTTLKGPVIGQRATDGNYTMFFGIPYTVVDENNPFGMSLDHPGFDTPFVADNKDILCPQGLRGKMIGILDCLRLNIYVPNIADSSNLVPVFVWVHGGVYQEGHGGEYGGRYLVEQDIVVVTINYRLGPYGFLCLDDPLVPGNQGLKDQVEALRWIKNNIAAFGGDPNQVTIAGESAGGGAVDFHLYSQYETLFHKAITQSGSQYVKGMFVPPDYDAANTLAEAIGYKPSSIRDALNFLMKSNVSDVISAFNKAGLEMRPCQEKVFDGVQNFITTDPYHSESGRVKDIEYLIGYNNKEEFFSYADQPEEYFQSIQDFFHDYIDLLYDIDNLQDIAQSIKKFYIDSRSVSKDVQLEIMDFGADFMVNRAVEKSVAKIFNQGGEKVYKYIFSYVGGSKYVNYTGVGASHMEELDYIFEREGFSLFNDELVLIKDRMTTMWANFVKYGNPTPQVSTLLPILWDPMTNLTHRLYINIDVSMTMDQNVFNERMALWELFDHAYWRNSRLILKSSASAVHGYGYPLVIGLMIWLMNSL